MTTRLPFAGLAPDARTARGKGTLQAFEIDAAMAMGAELRRTAMHVSTIEDLSRLIVEAVHSFDDGGRPASVLVRAFVTTPLKELPSDLEVTIRASLGELSNDSSANPTCLRLVSTSGIEPHWNDVTSSATHRVLLLEERAAPMVAELIRQLRLEDPHRSTATSFLVADPLASDAVPAKDFLKAYDIKSVFGIATSLAPTITLAVIAFSRVAVQRRTVRLFELFGLYAKLAWARTNRDQKEALEEILVLHGVLVREAVSDYRRSLQSEAAAAKTAMASTAELAKANANELRRSQRAMLNVIEDLREARRTLETTVTLRTRELATANTHLALRNQELEEFVYIASHDLQEPLRTVSGYLQMIERRYGDKLGPDGDEFIRFAIEGAQRMQALIESLLLYARISTAEKRMEAVALDEALDVALRNIALRVEETHALVQREPLPMVHADRIQMVQVFQNLVGNALKFSGPKPPRVHISATVAAGVAKIVVRDEGIGFNPKFNERIFKVFRRLRRDTPGTGIGLAICKKIVERHGGRIRADSTAGEGATFTVELPLEASSSNLFDTTP